MAAQDGTWQVPLLERRRERRDVWTSMTTGGFEIREGIGHVDFARVHVWLASSYWTPGIARERIELGTQNSALVLSAFDSASGEQIAFGRVVSDKTRFAYLCDVWVDENHRGRGIARALVRYALEHPEFTTITNWTLATKDAQGVYEPLGFRDIREPGAYPNTWMVLRKS